MVSLMMYGTRVSLIVGFSAALVAMVIGGAVGVLAGYFGGRIDTLLMRLTDYFLAIPDLPLMIVVAAVWGRSLRNIILIIGVIYWTTTARVVRAQVKSIRERGYIRRTRVVGASNTRLILRHVLPQVAPLLVATAVIMVAYAIFAETAIAFLGLGDPSVTSWGLLIQNAFARDAISVGAWWAIVPPGVAVAVVVVSLTMMGTAIEDVLNPRLRVSHLSVRLFRMRAAPPREDERMSAAPVLAVEDLHVWFDLGHDRELHAVQGTSFTLARGERMGLVGESGCGKTTLSLALMGLLPHNASIAGRVLLDGEDILARGEASVRPHRWRDIAMVFQGAMNAFNPVQRIGHQIVEAMELHEKAEGRGAPTRAAASCSSSSASAPSARAASRTSSPAACASARPSRWRSPATRACCSPTSRRPRST